MITLTNSTTAIPLQYPRTWDLAALTGVTLQIANTSAVELLAATAADLYTQTTLDAAADRFDRSITLDAGAEDLEIGDILRITGVAGYEDHVVRGWDTTNKVATLDLVLNRDFEDGATVDRLSAVCSVDLSDTDVFAPGTQLVLTWTPAGTGAPMTLLAEVEADDQINVADFTKDFKALYPRAYDALKEPADRLDVVLRLAQDELRLVLSARGLDIVRVKDQRLLNPLLMALVARYWTLNGDKEMSDERTVIDAAYSTAVEGLCKLPIWVDSDGDGIEDDGETQTYPVYFERVW